MNQDTDLGLFRIHGLIIPSAWDKEGNVLNVAVFTFDEDQYFVDGDEIGKQLIGLLRGKVEVCGVVGIKDGLKTIKVKKYVLNKKSI